MRIFRPLTSIVLIGLLSVPVAAQNSRVSESGKFKPRFSVGFDFTPEWCLSRKGSIDNYDPGNRFYPTFGVNFQTQLSQHDGIQLGAYYRTFHYTQTMPGYTVPGNGDYYVDPYRSGYDGKYVSVQLSYRFYSRILDFSAGFNADFVVGKNSDLRIGGKPELTWEGADPVNLYGFVLRFSKDITLYRGLILQPEVHVNPCIDIDGAYRGTFLGCGVGLKYRF